MFDVILMFGTPFLLGVACGMSVSGFIYNRGFQKLRKDLRHPPEPTE